MIKKKKLFVTIALSLLIIFASGNNVLANPLSVDEYQSNFSCWCACASQICGYFENYSTEQDYYNCEGAIFYYYGGQVNGNIDWIEGGVQYITDINGSVQYNPLSWTAVKYQINNDCPIAAALGDYYGSQHAITIRGYKTENFINYCYYVDPYDGLYHLRAYNYLVNSWDWANSAFWA
ncbi:MAG: papain-like cysteine protease family protein [Mahellales bacterium]|jgi:hypothetical protein